MGKSQICRILRISPMLRHWEIHESTKETQVEIILQRAREQFPQARREEKLATARAAQKGPAIRRTLR